MKTETNNNVILDGEYLHQRWDEKLSPAIVELFVKNAELFEDEYDPDRIERKILRHIKMYKEDLDLYDFDILNDRLEQLAKDDLSAAQMRMVHSIAKEVDRYLTEKDEGIMQTIDLQMYPKLLSLIEECSTFFRFPHAAKDYIQDICNTIINECHSEYDACDFLDELETISRSNLTRSEKAQLSDLADELYDTISEPLKRN